MSKYCIVMYSHSSYSDVWQMFFGQIDKYFDKSIKRYVFSDDGQVPENWKLVKYNDSDAYNQRVAKCFDKIDEEYCIFHHEDMPLYDCPNIDFINKKVKLMEEDSIDCIKLIKGGNLRLPIERYKDHDNLFHLSKMGLYFSVQPSLFKINSIKELYRNCDIDKIHEFEPKAHTMSILMNLKNLYYYDGEPQRGQHHCDSNVYPYIATAIVKGKWNYSEYEKELDLLCNEYNIDKDIRGCV
tara:strand:+ start:178 stop:897 length:720 start_codon:yes stop_codon:yes gene_type:complete